MKNKQNDSISVFRKFPNIITRSPKMFEVLRLAEKVAKTPNTTVAIYGESGAGKELLARAIHQSSGRAEETFVGVNCAGIPQGLLESELFGHVRGAFTGADSDREGKFGMARNGTLLLDEIGDMPLALQAKILRVLEECVYERVGADKKIETSARIITTTHRNLENLVRSGAFRKDLFHRISTFPITLPPLRERKEDIPLLVDFFLDHFQKEIGKPVPGISEAAMELLENYNWPGNIRELRNCIERALIVTNEELVRPDHLTLRRKVERSGSNNFEDENKIRIDVTFDIRDFSLDAVVDHTLKIVLEKCGNNKARAAELLGVDRKIFYRRKQKRR